MLIKGLYTVQSFEQNGQEIQATVKLNAAHDVFKGHFPGNPILPGVCAIQMIKELTEEATGKTLFLSVASNIKFMAIINPEKNDTIHLVLHLSEDDNQIKVKNTVSFEETLALKLNASFKIVA
ncbi:3-hydroxyacyl-ACP dehydratase [Aggregatimonas sangjinii]|uniref:3-hydroxyacyl-ACP dehydratase n=1 Tax=Aggregatimonas sangjinii TaxID=2583587 RepID=UPI001585FEC4|nr:3-hydroxyacyl-ACP dehydratase [Aggregatimonas sangjinii]